MYSCARRMNRKRTERLSREEGLTVRKRRGRMRATGTRAPILTAAAPNARWSVDFVHDQLACGRRLRVLNVIDDVTNECLAAVVDTSISGRRVARELAAIVGPPGPAGAHRQRTRYRVHLERHARMGARNGDRLALHRPGQAARGTACARRSTDADELLNGIRFFGLGQAHAAVARWVADYERHRPHSRSRTPPRPPIAPSAQHRQFDRRTPASGAGRFPVGIATEAAGNGTTSVAVRMDDMAAVAA